MSDDPTIGIDERARDPLTRGMLSAHDLFSGMLATPDTPRPSLAEHPTKGICLSCGREFPNAWFGFCGGWAVHRRCDACAAHIKPKVGPQPIRQYGDRTEQRSAA